MVGSPRQRCGYNQQRDYYASGYTIQNGQPQKHSSILIQGRHLPVLVNSLHQKTPTVSAIGVFAFIFFVNHKSADFVLSARVAPQHFLVKYSIK
ncbi:hypothetical protein DEG99_01925 [Salmonella enterica]|nr:hypothetical protein [Salmonella enterica]